MKNYRITVNGVEYEVSVEEIEEGSVKAAAPAAPAKMPKEAVKTEKTAASAGKEGSTKIQAPMPGKILTIKTEVGKPIKKGEVVLVLEAMKMENEIYSSTDGVVASVNVAAGDMVESGDVLITID